MEGLAPIPVPVDDPPEVKADVKAIIVDIFEFDYKELLSCYNLLLRPIVLFYRGL
jgi:hypothetical protein